MNGRPFFCFVTFIVAAWQLLFRETIVLDALLYSAPSIAKVLNVDEAILEVQKYIKIVINLTIKKSVCRPIVMKAVLSHSNTQYKETKKRNYPI